ncbi:MAG: 50S ribosomal protein L18 [candidate division WOR-3 bacterium]
MIRDRRKRRHLSLRRRIAGTQERPRLCVSRSNRQVSAALVDDSRGRVLTTVTSLLGQVRDKKLKRTEAAKEVGRLVAARAREMGIVQVVFDRGGYRYHGRVKAVAEGAREGGLKF